MIRLTPYSLFIRSVFVRRPGSIALDSLRINSVVVKVADTVVSIVSNSVLVFDTHYFGLFSELELPFGR